MNVFLMLLRRGKSLFTSSVVQCTKLKVHC